MKNKKIKKGDVLLLIALLILSAGGFYLTQQSVAESGNRVVIKQAGNPIGIYPLEQDKVLELETKWGKNKVVIKDGKAYIESADCRDQYCVKHKPISANNDSIICLPHKLVVEIVKEQEKTEVDSIAN